MRAVDATEALTIGLANRVVPKGQARAAAEELAAELAALPQQCMRSDRLSALHQWGIPETDALDYEFASISRVAAEANTGEILVSSTVKDLVAGSGIEFEDRGEHQLKGISQAWRLFKVAG